MIPDLFTSQNKCSAIMYTRRFGLLACRLFAKCRVHWPRTVKQLRPPRLLVQSGRMVSHSTVDPAEVRKFQALASRWWDEQGEFGALHAMNKLRVPFIRDNLLKMHSVQQVGRPLSGFRILDIGCGGGLLTEPLARLGADVLGIDPVQDSARIAELHLSHDPMLGERVQYRACCLEDLAEEKEDGFHAVLASEVLEHLADMNTFIQCCHQVLKPGGSLFITTINRTHLSYVLGIVLAEQILHIVPRGTHDWEKFISPVELETLLESTGFSVECIRGMLYNPVSKNWSWQQCVAVNYALHAIKWRKEPELDRAQTESQKVDKAVHAAG